MPEDRELGPKNPRINRWLEGVQSAIDEGNLHGSEEGKRSVRWNRKVRSQPSLLIHHWHSENYIEDKNRNIESLDLESGHCKYFSSCPGREDTTALTLPKIPTVPGQRSPQANDYSLEVIDLETLSLESTFVGAKDKQMESNNSSNDEKSDGQVYITEGVNQLSFNKYGNEEILEDETLKESKLLITRFETTGSVHNGYTDPLTVIQNEPTDLRCETNNTHVQAATPLGRDKAKFSLPSLITCNMRRHADHEVPSITVCQDGESRARKVAHRDLDPRFLMPTESSVEEARYLLASRRGSLPCVGRNIRRRSLDMVAEEQPSDHRGGDRVTTSLASLRVPRHRNRSRSLDNSLETSNNFAAFKESLKLRNVKKNVFGT